MILMASSLGGMSYIGDPVGYAFIKHLAIGAAGGAVLVPVENLSFAEGTSLDIDFGDLTYIPVPVIGGYAKISFKRVELGAKLAGFPAYSADGIEVKNMIIGGKIRYRLGGFNIFLVKGGVSVGALYEYMNGGLTITQEDGFPIYGDEYDLPDVKIGTVTTTAAIENSWSANTIGGEAQANFQILFLNFFLGSRLSKTFGKATSDFSGTVDLKPEPDYEYVTQAENEKVSAFSETKPSGIDIYGFGGAEVKLLIFTVGARGTYNFTNNNLTIDGGLRLQF